MKRIIVFSVVTICLFCLLSCASGAAIVTGTKRAPTNPNSVIIYTETPSDYEVIGIVTASSDSGLTEQGDLNYAVAELKRQAARLGANGVVIDSINTTTSGAYIHNGGYISSTTAKNISGKAIYVLSDENK